ncbi:MAG: DUF58 domain-containing protein [Phycisphaeraceae bacterium]|nr:DUF58 domain-containing protein [Phycisphaeraceae bacterium]
MSRQRIQIGPSGKAYGVVALLTLLGAVNTQANLIFWFFGLQVGALVISAAWAWMGLRKLDVERVAPPRAVCGRTMLLRYRVRNRGRWLGGFNVVIEESPGEGKASVDGPPRARARLTSAWVLRVGPGGEANVAAPALAETRGLLELDGLEVSASFPLGILRAVRRVSQPATVVVLPRLRRLRPAALRQLRQQARLGQSVSDQAGGDQDFYGIREYRVGQSVRLIDWKRSARTGRLLTREMTRPRAPRLTVVLDLGAGAIGPEEWRQQWIEDAVSLAGSLVHHAHDRGVAVGLEVRGEPARRLPARSSEAHRDALMAVLAVCRTGRVGGASSAAWAVDEVGVIVRPGPTQGSAAEGTAQAGGPVGAMAGAWPTLGSAEIERWAWSDAEESWADAAAVGPEGGGAWT